MKSPIYVTLFDLGSTLIYEKEPWEPFFDRADAALWEVLHKAGVKLNASDLYGDFDTLLHFYYARHRGGVDEPTTFTVLDELLRSKDRMIPEDVLRAAMRAMYAVTQANWLPEADAIPTLQALRARGVGIGLISNAADDENTQVLIDKGGFRPYLDYIISSAAFGKRKPHIGIFQAALAHFHVSPEKAVMIGDTYEADIIGGEQAGMNTIWITRRVRKALDDPRPRADALITTLAEIPPLLFS
jgi:HAD superfamily hydrolase (TIGR01509 family)